MSSDQLGCVAITRCTCRDGWWVVANMVPHKGRPRESQGGGAVVVVVVVSG